MTENSPNAVHGSKSLATVFKSDTTEATDTDRYQNYCVEKVAHNRELSGNSLIRSRVPLFAERRVDDGTTAGGSKSTVL